ncbi:MAG: metallophosphoesterase [Balneolales bacterium]
MQKINQRYVFGYLAIFVITLFIHQTGYAQADSVNNSKSLLILHTNDIHDHLRADYDGGGGLPFVSGFIRGVRLDRDDVIVMDAGDVAEKGELVARKTTSDLTFKAMARIGYKVWAPGNHDHDFGIDALYRFTDLGNMDIVCINLLKENGTPEFPPSKIYEINGIQVGVIGAIRPRDERSLDLDGTALAMAEEARRLKSSTDIIIGLVHISINNSVYISKNAPDIDVIISGHSHQKTPQPVIVPETGALIVQSGSYAENVGWLELDLDLNNRKIESFDYKLVEMSHSEVSPDLEMMEWIRLEELELAPEALEIISWAPREISRIEVGILAAEALRKGSNADIALHKTAHIVRATLPKGILDVNAFYRTGGERGEFLVEVDLSGSEINNYIQGLPMNDWYPTNWSGFYGTFEDGVFTSDLDKQKLYTVVMPELEWRQRFQKLHSRVESNPEEWPGISPLSRMPDVRDIDIKWIESVTSLLRDFNKNEIGLIEGIEDIAQQTGQLQMLKDLR